jgi:mannose-1-phosphate guanylyltransferase
MKAMILAAGKGKRLRPLTEVLPKALVPVVNRAMLERTIELLSLHGAQELIINAHHQSQRITDYLKRRDYSALRIEVSVEEEILGTGGGIKNTRHFWDERPFIVINSDIITDIDLTAAYAYHQSRGNMATLVLHDLHRYNKLTIDKDMNILSIKSTSGEKGALAFTGIHVMNPEVLDHIPEDVPCNIIDCYRQLIQEKRAVRAYVATGHRWIDIGTIHDYQRANRDLLGPEKLAIGQDCHIHPEAKLDGWAILGDRCSIERGALIQGSVLWNEVTVREGVRVVDSVVTTGTVVEQDIVGGVAIQ